MPHPCPKLVLLAANCMTPIAVFGSVFPHTRHAAQGWWVSFFFFKQQMERNSYSALLPRPLSRGTHPCGVMRALVHIWISVHSKLVGWSRTISRFSEGPAAWSLSGFPPGHMSGRVGSRTMSSPTGNLWVVGSEEPALFARVGGRGAGLESSVALEHVIVRTSERPREEFSGREAFREWGSCLPVWLFLSPACTLSVLVGVMRFAPLHFEIRKPGRKGEQSVRVTS